MTIAQPVGAADFEDYKDTGGLINRSGFAVTGPRKAGSHLEGYHLPLTALRGAYSYRKAIIGSTFMALLAGR
jgi:hypothetical protein